MLTGVRRMGGKEKTTMGNSDDCRLTTLVNSASTALPIGLPQKMAKFWHTFNRLLGGPRRQCALLECPQKSNLLHACLLIGRFFWFFCQQIWFSQILCFTSFSVPEVACLSAGLLICFKRHQKKIHSLTATTPKRPPLINPIALPLTALPAPCHPSR
jgi:hypothetical protein